MTERIGDFLLRIGAMNEIQVDEVLRIQREDEEPRMFGEIAVELGYINDAALKSYIDQKAKESAS
jgi:hypothetical protein